MSTKETQIQSMPEEGELVLATVNEINPHGVYVTLDEYDKVRAFLHISEIATGWVRDIERYAKPGQKIVLKVIRQNRNRREIDLSLRQVSGEEKRQKIIEVKKNEKARTILDALKSRLSLDEKGLAISNRIFRSAKLSSEGRLPSELSLLMLLMWEASFLYVS